MTTKKGKQPPKPKQMKSGFEKKVAAYLSSNKVPFEYETLRVPFVVPAKKRTYNPDFMLPHGVIIEAKGKLDRDVREKMALVLEQNPQLDIRMLFMRDNKIAKNSKTRYSDWCKKRGIKYAVSEQGHVPEQWLVDAQGANGSGNTSGGLDVSVQATPDTGATSSRRVRGRGLPLDGDRGTT
jgi:hypothetical protein